MSLIRLDQTPIRSGVGLVHQGTTAGQHPDGVVELGGRTRIGASSDRDARPLELRHGTVDARQRCQCPLQVGERGVDVANAHRAGRSADPDQAAESVVRSGELERPIELLQAALRTPQGSFGHTQCPASDRLCFGVTRARRLVDRLARCRPGAFGIDLREQQEISRSASM